MISQRESPQGWYEAITVLELDEYGNVRVLDAAAWQQRRQRQQEAGRPAGAMRRLVREPTYAATLAVP